MSEGASENREAPTEATASPEALTQVDAAVAGNADPETGHGRVNFNYGDGGVPIYVGFIWIVFILSYILVMSIVALPDFISWFSA